jgi:FkbM family methyltransferase
VEGNLMLLNFEKIYKDYKMDIRGILHIGAHYGQEYKVYKEHEIKNIMFFEPLEKNFLVLEENMQNEPGVALVKKALGNQNSEVRMYVESDNQGQSSSVLMPRKHLVQYPHIRFHETELVEMVKLDDFLKPPERKKYNFINIDVQGYELEVFKGSTEILNNIDYIISEVNRDDLYFKCARVEEIDEFLEPYGFIRVETNWEGHTWGDALYVRGATC